MARRLSVVQQAHAQQAPTGGAVHLSCPPLQAGIQGHAKACAPGSPSPRPAPSVPAPLFPCTIRTIRELVTCKNHPSPGGHTHTFCPLAALTHPHTHTDPATNSTRSRQTIGPHSGSSCMSRLQPPQLGRPQRSQQNPPRPQHANCWAPLTRECQARWGQRGPGYVTVAPVRNTSGGEAIPETVI